VLLNQQLERFCDEGLPYTRLGWQVLEELRRRRRRWVWQVWDRTVLDRVPIAATYAGRFGAALCTATDWGTLAGQMGVAAPLLRAAIDRYNKHFLAAGPERDFGRTIAGLRPLEHPPYSAARVGVWVTASNGGLRADEEGRVLTSAGTPVDGLYAAGNDMGGLVGSGYVAGILLLGAVVFGRIAGENAASGRIGAARGQEH
jgi:fumarate reductase flavoprotein subunit